MRIVYLKTTKNTVGLVPVMKQLFKQRKKLKQKIKLPSEQLKTKIKNEHKLEYRQFGTKTQSNLTKTRKSLCKNSFQNNTICSIIFGNL